MWKKSSFSQGNSNCVEVYVGKFAINVRDSKLGEDSPVHTYTFEEWQAFLDGVRNGEFDLPRVAVTWVST